jgi:hypothetical protein
LAFISLIVVSSLRSSKKSPRGAMIPLRAIEISPPSSRRQPVRSIDSLPGLNNSIHSSYAEERVPAQAISLIRTACGGKDGIGVSEDVGVDETACPVGEGVVGASGTTLGVTERMDVGVGVFSASVGLYATVVVGEGFSDLFGDCANEREPIPEGEMSTRHRAIKTAHAPVARRIANLLSAVRAISCPLDACPALGIMA